MILDILAGYGYKPIRTLFTYLIVILGFSTGYYFIWGPASNYTLAPIASAVFSISSFHGRGFFPSSNIGLDSPMTIAASIEAIIGLIIEASFIATFTQRFFGK